MNERFLYLKNFFLLLLNSQVQNLTFCHVTIKNEEVCKSRLIHDEFYVIKLLYLNKQTYT